MSPEERRCRCGAGRSADELVDDWDLCADESRDHEMREALRGLLAFYDATLGCATFDAGDELIVDGVRVLNIVSLIEEEESVRFDAALDAAEPHAEAARALLAGDQS